MEPKTEYHCLMTITSETGEGVSNPDTFSFLEDFNDKSTREQRFRAALQWVADNQSVDPLELTVLFCQIEPN